MISQSLLLLFWQHKVHLEGLLTVANYYGYTCTVYLRALPYTYSTTTQIGGTQYTHAHVFRNYRGRQLPSLHPCTVQLRSIFLSSHTTLLQYKYTHITYIQTHVHLTRPANKSHVKNCFAHTYVTACCTHIHDLKKDEVRRDTRADRELALLHLRPRAPVAVCHHREAIRIHG